MFWPILFCVPLYLLIAAFFGGFVYERNRHYYNDTESMGVLAGIFWPIVLPAWGTIALLTKVACLGTKAADRLR